MVRVKLQAFLIVRLRFSLLADDCEPLDLMALPKVLDTLMLSLSPRLVI